MIGENNNHLRGYQNRFLIIIKPHLWDSASLRAASLRANNDILRTIWSDNSWLLKSLLCYSSPKWNNFCIIPHPMFRIESSLETILYLVTTELPCQCSREFNWHYSDWMVYHLRRIVFHGSLSFSLSLPLTLSPSISSCLSQSLSLSLSLSFSLCPKLYFSFFLSTLHLSVSIYLSFSLSPSFSVLIYYSLTLCLSPSFSFWVSWWLKERNQDYQLTGEIQCM